MIPRFQHFPVQKAGAPANEPRRDRGANNKRLHVIDAEPGSFAVPIAGTQPEAHETPDSTRDEKGVLKVAPCGHSRGLPAGCTVDDVITLEQAAAWLQVPLAWLKERSRVTPGVITETNKVKRFHPRTYLDARLRRFRK